MEIAVLINSPPLNPPLQPVGEGQGAASSRAARYAVAKARDAAVTGCRTHRKLQGSRAVGRFDSIGLWRDEPVVS
jgi:hypothetical protein